MKKKQRAAAEEAMETKEQSPVTEQPEALEESAPEASEMASGETPTEAVDPIAALKAERDDLLDQLLRARAEFDNYRKRIARESERTRTLAAEALMRDMLPVMDNLALALKYKDEDTAALAEGVSMVARQMEDTLGRHGLSPIVTAECAFDPNVHEAVAKVPSEAIPVDGVVEEYQRGYTLGAMVLRPSKVTVSAGPAEASGGDE